MAGKQVCCWGGAGEFASQNFSGQPRGLYVRRAVIRHQRRIGTTSRSRSALAARNSSRPSLNSSVNNGVGLIETRHETLRRKTRGGDHRSTRHLRREMLRMRENDCGGSRRQGVEGRRGIIFDGYFYNNSTNSVWGVPRSGVGDGRQAVASAEQQHRRRVLGVRVFGRARPAIEPAGQGGGVSDGGV